MCTGCDHFSNQYILGWNYAMKNKILLVLSFFLLIPADLLFIYSKDKEVIKKDLEKYCCETPYRDGGIKAFNFCMLINRPFRNIFYYRVKNSMILRNISKVFIHPLPTIEIMGTIGEGFRISHNYAVVHPQIAGKNLFVGHGATIGKGSTNQDGRIYPVIGDNVEIYANAVVFGGITIGNNVKIGAGTVVNRDVPDNCTVVGNPCRIITRD